MLKRVLLTLLVAVLSLGIAYSDDEPDEGAQTNAQDASAPAGASPAAPAMSAPPLLSQVPGMQVEQVAVPWVLVDGVLDLSSAVEPADPLGDALRQANTDKRRFADMASEWQIHLVGPDLEPGRLYSSNRKLEGLSWDPAQGLSSHFTTIKRASSSLLGQTLDLIWQGNVFLDPAARTAQESLDPLTQRLWKESAKPARL